MSIQAHHNRQSKKDADDHTEHVQRAHVRLAFNVRVSIEDI